MLNMWLMWVSPNIQIFYTLELNNIKTRFSGKIIFLDKHIAEICRNI